MKPIGTDERYLTLDALRGLALLGVLLVNDVDFFRVSLFDQIRLFHTHPGWGNRLVDVLVAGLLEFKAFTLFSFLFGVGIAIQAERLGSHGARVPPFLVRRFAVLLGFGLIHMFLISNVDILCLYAVCGLFAVPLLRCRAALLAGFGLGAVVLTLLHPFGGLFPSERVMQEYATKASRVYAAGSFSELVVFRFAETGRCILPLLLSALPRTFGVVLLGVAAWRAGFLRKPDVHRRWFAALALGGGVLGAVGTGLVVFQRSCGRPPPGGLPMLDILLAAAYASAFLLWMANRRPGIVLQSIAALGQMALTDYLLQSVIFGLIFYSYGLGLFGRLAPLPAAIIGGVIYLGQLVFSRAWLKNYRFGPAEWLWRSLTYGERQPMLQTVRSDVQTAAQHA